MWKTRESFRGGGKFCPQPDVETFYFFHRACERNFCQNFFHRLSFHISQGLWRKFGAQESADFGMNFFEMKPGLTIGWAPPAAVFLLLQENR